MIFLAFISVVAALQVLQVRPWAGIATCEFGGTEVEIVRQALNTQKKKEGIDYSFECLDPGADPLQAALSPAGGIVFGGVVINSASMRAGARFTAPTFSSGLSMMVKTKTSPGLWHVFSSFSVWIWVLFLTVPLFVGAANFGYSILLSADRRKTLMDVSLLSSCIGKAYSKLFVSRMESADSGQLALGSLLVFTRLMLLCYICSFAAKQYEKMQDRIEDVKDITGKLTFVPVGLRTETAQYPITYYPKYPDGSENPVEMLKDEDVMVYIDDHAKLCDLEDSEDSPASVAVNSQSFRRYTYGVLLSPSVDRNFADALNAGLSVLRETTRVVDMLDDGGLLRLPSIEVSSSVGLQEVWGVFLVMGIAAVFALLLSFIPLGDFFSRTWQCFLPSRAEYSLHAQPSQASNPSITNRTEILDGLEMVPAPASFKATTTEVSFTVEELTQSPSFDGSETDSKLTSSDPQVTQDTVELIRTTTLMLLLFEASFSEGIDRFAQLVEREDTRKAQLTEVVRDFD